MPARSRPSDRAARRHGGVRRLPARERAPVVLPLDGHALADGHRHEAAGQRRDRRDDPADPRRNGNLRLPRERDRGADRPRCAHGHHGGAEEAPHDRADERPLHRLRLRPRRPRGRRRVPRRRRPVRRPRLQSRRARDRPRAERALHRGQRHEGRGPRGRRARAGARARRVPPTRTWTTSTSSSRRASERPDMHDRRAGIDRGRRAEDAPRRRGPRRAAVRERGPGDREADAEAAGLRVPRHRLAARRPRPPLRGDRDHDRVPAGRPDDPRDPRPARDRRADRRAAQGRRHVRHDARSRRGAEPGRRADRGRHAAGAERSSKSCSRRERGQLPARSDHGARGALAEAAGAEVELERPSEPAHGDYATNVALRLAPSRSARRGSSPRSWPPPPRRSARRRARRGRGARVRQPLPRRLLVRRCARRDPRRGRRLRRRLRRDEASACRSRWSRRTRPARSPSPRRGTARSATRSRACSSSAGTRSSASTTTTTPARRWSTSARRSRRCGAGRSRRRTATRATTSASSRRSRATRCRRCSSGSRRRSSGSASISTRGRSRASSRSGSRS